MSCDLEKAKIEIVRDALKDVTDTVRAQDRKASYMIAIIFFLVTAFTLTTLRINEIVKIEYLDHLILFYPILYFIVGVGFLFYSYNPVSNPTKVLSKEDADYGADKFFVSFTKDRDKDATKLVENFLSATSDIKGILKILYIEILKLSKIRDRKISLIKNANVFLFTGLITGVVQIVTFYKFSFELFGLSLLCIVSYFLFKKG